MRIAIVLLSSVALMGNHVFQRPDLEYLKAVNSVAPPQDPQLLFLLMGQYSNANLQEEGAAFFSDRLKEFGPRLSNPQKALYLSAIGLLRAQHASDVPLLHRMAYVKETLAMLDQAHQLSGGQVFVVNWIAGVVEAQIPSIFGRKAAAQEQLQWCLKNADKAPDRGWLREVEYQLAGQQRPITLVTPFSEGPSGHTFSPKRIAEIVPGRVFVLSGFEFTEYYFVVSDNGRELIGIDAGTRPDSAKAAYEALRGYAPGLPALTTIFVTHSHWDHVGGHSFFDGLNPRPRFYARSNYQEEIARDLTAPGVFDKHFFGEGFNPENLRSFKPEVTVSQITKLTVGGTGVELIPIQGGETHDGMLIHFPTLQTMFVGDFMMPYLGAPFAEEGDLQGLLDAIDIVVDRHPAHLLHGHEPLTRNFTSTALLAELKPDLAWLREQVLTAIRRGDERGTIYKANLIPPGLLKDQPDAYLPYLIMREHVIDRLYDQNVGYWQGDLQGMEHLTNADRAELLVDYLGVTDKQLAKTVERLAADGKYELAAALLQSSGKRFEHSEAVGAAKRLVYLKLMEKAQNSDPFKFIIYSSMIGEQIPQMR
jgi:glyoxylase-like metal-dependent hydrolase (beta-lactamase superfamily II)